MVYKMNTRGFVSTLSDMQVPVLFVCFSYNTCSSLKLYDGLQVTTTTGRYYAVCFKMGCLMSALGLA